MEKIKKFKPYLIYTCIFAIMALLIFWIFIKFGKSFVREGDGFYQHYVFLHGFSRLVQEVFQNLGNGIPMFMWEMGLGLDIIGQFSYYMTGDLFSYIGVLFPQDNLEFVYNMLIILRIYVAGIAFMAYARYHNKSDVLCAIGGIMYSLCSFNLTYGMTHPFFINATIMFPIMLIAIDKLIDKDKITTLTTVVFLTAIMNYYFFYKITIISFIYAIIRILCEKKDNKLQFFTRKMLKIILAYIIAVLCAAIILLPTIYAFFNSDRLGSEMVSYNSSYYQNLLVGGKGFTTTFWVPSIAILLIPIAISKFKEKENKYMTIMFLVQTVMLMIPIIGSIMNGFSFPINRWSFMYIFVLIYMSLCGINEKLKYSKKEILIMIFTSLIYIVVLMCLDKISLNMLKMTTLFLSIFMIIILLNNLNINYLKRVNKYVIVFIGIVICVNILAYKQEFLGIENQGNIKNFVDSGKVAERYASCNNLIQNFDKAIENIKKQDNSFYRIGEYTKYSKNESLLYGYKALNSYFSIGNGYVGKLSRELLNKYYEKVDALNGLDNRTKITTLMSSKYYISPKNKNSYIPYGYKLKEEIPNEKDGNNTTQIYENKYYLPIGVFYDNYTLKSDYDNLTALEKEQIILDTAVIEDVENLEKYNIKKDEELVNKVKETTTTEVDYNLRDDYKIVKEQEIVPNKNNQSITLQINNVIDSELYLYIEDLQYEPNNSTNDYKIIVDYNSINNVISVEDKKTVAYYVDMPNKLVNLGYKKEHSGDIKITFSKSGKYKYKSIKVIAVPMNNYVNSVKKLQKNKFKLTSYKNNYLKGNIKVESNGILQFSTPYTKGWTAFVDGQKVETINVNTAFIGIPLEQGEHEIYLKYETPWLKAGIVLTILGIIGFIILIFYERKSKQIGEKNG